MIKKSIRRFPKRKNKKNPTPTNFISFHNRTKCKFPEIVEKKTSFRADSFILVSLNIPKQFP